MSSDGGGSSSKKKAAPKSRKRKTSDAGTTTSKSLLVPGKRLLTDADSALAGSDCYTDIQTGPAAQLKPLERGELTDSSKFALDGRMGTFSH